LRRVLFDAIQRSALSSFVALTNLTHFEVVQVSGDRGSLRARQDFEEQVNVDHRSRQLPNIGTKRCVHPAPQSSNWKHGHVPVIFYRDSIR
jgi:hypothetical protein